MSKTVYRVLNFAEAYHTDESCPKLNRAEETVETTERQILRLPECKVCGGDNPANKPKKFLFQTLQEMDPDEVGKSA